MVYTTEYASPLGAITLACDEEAIIGLWFNGSDILGISCRSEPSRKSDRCSQMRNAGWTYIFLDGAGFSAAAAVGLHAVPQNGLRDYADDSVWKDYDLRRDCC